MLTTSGHPNTFLRRNTQSDSRRRWWPWWSWLKLCAEWGDIQLHHPACIHCHEESLSASGMTACSSPDPNTIPCDPRVEWGCRQGCKTPDSHPRVSPLAAGRECVVKYLRRDSTWGGTSQLRSVFICMVENHRLCSSFAVELKGDVSALVMILFEHVGQYVKGHIMIMYSVSGCNTNVMIQSCCRKVIRLFQRPWAIFPVLRSYHASKDRRMLRSSCT